MIVKKHRIKTDSPAIQYEIKWLKSDEHMRFFREDIIVISNVD
tara:strand:+ start:1285 stop:1413 length:129 start_codon:yes stop_codon:yes gene_type:complete